MIEPEAEPRPSGGRHGSAECRLIAENGLIMQCLAGSGLHGISIASTDDRDEVGVCIEPPRYVIGLGTIQGAPFEQYLYRSQPEGVRSGPGDLDLTVYGLRKWMKLAMAGNPTIILPFFAPEENFTYLSEYGRQLLALREKIVTRQAGQRFIGYLQQQLRRLESHHGKGKDVTRPELIQAYGFDTKYAAHMVRLGWQGEELMVTGTLTLPVPEPQRAWLMDLREGKHTMKEAVHEATTAARRIQAAIRTSPLRQAPDEGQIDQWLARAHLQVWASRAMIP